MQFRVLVTGRAGGEPRERRSHSQTSDRGLQLPSLRIHRSDPISYDVPGMSRVVRGLEETAPRPWLTVELDPPGGMDAPGLAADEAIR